MIHEDEDLLASELEADEGSLFYKVRLDERHLPKSYAYRECRVCGETKNLIEGFYQTRKSRGPVASSFSYECKLCTIRRIIKTRKKRSFVVEDNYPDW